MERTGPLLAVLTAALLAAPGLTALSSAARAADADPVRNGGFESGPDAWTRTSGTTVDSPVRSGSSALKATPAGSDNARCAQTVTVEPDARYTLSGRVRGVHVHWGASGTGACRADDISPVDALRLPRTPPTAPGPRCAGGLMTRSVNRDRCPHGESRRTCDGCFGRGRGRSRSAAPCPDTSSP